MQDAIVVGAGIVGLSTAVQLTLRGIKVTLVDRTGVGAGASFGNGGLIQREAVAPYAFPSAFSEIWTHARRKSVTVNWHASAMPRMAADLWRYWRGSSPIAYRNTTVAQAQLIARAPEAHLALARRCGIDAEKLLRPIGWMRVHAQPRTLDADLKAAEGWKREFGVEFDLHDTASFAREEPSFQQIRVGALHWKDSLSISDPGALLMQHASLFTGLGGRILRGDAKTLSRHGTGWKITTDEGVVEADAVVIAAGVWSREITRRFGYAPPLFGKRGYHMHYQLAQGARLNRPLVDVQSGFLLAPMDRGIRLTTGVELAHPDASPTPVQLAAAEPVARGLLPLENRVDSIPWMGVRPCTPDMLAIIGPVPAVAGMWCAFGHGHQGMTLGPITGELLAAMICGEKAPDFMAPFRPERFR